METPSMPALPAPPTPTPRRDDFLLDPSHQQGGRGGGRGEEGEVIYLGVIIKQLIKTSANTNSIATKIGIQKYIAL